MKKIIIIVLVAITIIGASIVLDNKNKSDLSKNIETLGCGYEDYCTDEFLSELNKETYTAIGSYIKKYKIAGMLKDNSYYKYNDVTSTFYIYTKDNNGIDLEKDNGYVEAEVVFIDNEGNRIRDEFSAIKVRGNSTAYAPKKPYNIKFSEKQNLLGFGKAKKWNLLADCFDPTLMRNKLFLDLALELGIDNTSQSQYVELYIDGIYRGCYLLTEAVETGKNRVDIDIDKGDFFIELEKEREEEGVTYIASKHGIRFALSDPEEPDNNQLEHITNVINEFDERLFSNNYNQLEEFIDVDSFVRVYLLNEFAKVSDFGYSSVFFYYKDNKLYAGPVWDFDLSSGNYTDNEKLSYGYWIKESGVNVSYSDFKCRNTSIIYKQLLTYPEAYSKYKELLNTNYDLLESTFINGGYIDQTLNTYGWLFDKNFEDLNNGGAGWDISTIHTNIEKKPYDTYQENVDYLTEWLENRLNWLKVNS